MAELLLELGCEELPATFVRKAYSDLRDKVSEILVEAKLGDGSGVDAIGTPRRLIISASGIRERQSDEIKEVRGPALKAAYGPDGNPSNALIGFFAAGRALCVGLQADRGAIGGRSFSRVVTPGDSISDL
jgi:glycyl-tRNA synthetase beta chain